jgi:hypothetical protein
MGKQIQMGNVICLYCEVPAHLVGGLAIYPHRKDLADRWFYLCKLCRAYVGCHPGTEKPLGRLANAELRQWKQRAHRVFDPLWKSGKMSRRRAYEELRKVLGMTEDECHIGEFDVENCKRLVRSLTQQDTDV